MSPALGVLSARRLASAATGTGRRTTLEDDLVEPRAKQIRPAAVPPFPWSHRIPRSRGLRSKGIRAFDSRESPISILQGNRPKHPETRQNPHPRFAQMFPPITNFCGFSRSTKPDRFAAVIADG